LPHHAFRAAELKALYEKHGSALAAYACCFGLDFGSAEDVVQQVFLKLLEGRVACPQTPAAYLYRSVRNTALNRRRDITREAEMPEVTSWLISPDGLAEEALAVRAALRDLPDEQREAIFLKVWAGMTLQEIADLLDISINTAASRYRYAVEKLRTRLLP